MRYFLLYLLSSITIVQLLFYLLIFSRLAFYKKPLKEEKNVEAHLLPAVSVIICAKNEAANLRNYLPSILMQNYPHFEIVVVNDASIDETEKVLVDFKKKHSNLVLVNISDSKRNMLGKKFALTKGIDASKHNILLLTDADCAPSSSHWIRTMVQHFAETKQKNQPTAIILGYGPYYEENTLLNRCIQFETVYTAMQYLSLAQLKMPYMGVGRNLCYHKSVFYGIGGFAAHKNISSGDDDLFINQIATGNNTFIEIDQRAFCYSKAAKTWKSWYRQKQRHLSTGKHYPRKFQLLLGALSLSHSLFYITSVITLLLHNHYTFVIILFIFRLSIQLLLFQRILQKLKSGLPLWMIPFLDFAYLLFYIIFIPSLLLNKEVKWKQRVL